MKNIRSFTFKRTHTVKHGTFIMRSGFYVYEFKLTFKRDRKSLIEPRQYLTEYRIQKTCLKVILGEMFIDYPSAMEMTGLVTLSNRRLKRCLDFSLKSVKHDRNSRLFPINKSAGMLNVRIREKFQVNFAATSTYKDSTIPFCQRLLNTHFLDK